MGTARILLDFAGSVFVALGVLHALYTFLDIAQPRRLVPQDPDVMRIMANAGLRLSRGRTSMWRAWVGFNFSHSLGVILFGCSCIVVGNILGHSAVPAWVLFALTLVGLVYFALGVLYWFRVPVVGIVVGTSSLLLAWAVYVYAGL